MQIVDAQIHLWGTGLPSNLSHRQVTAFTPAEAIALMDEGGVDAAVIHPPGWDPNSTEMAFQAVQNYPGRFAVMGAVPLDRPESRARIASWRQQPGMLGLRYGFLSDPARQWLRDGTLDWLWATAENAGVPIATLATDSLTELGRIAERHPGLPPLPPKWSIVKRSPGCGGQSDRCASLFERGLPISCAPLLSAPCLRCFRPQPHVLGHRHHEDALLLARMRDDVHRRIAVAQ